MIRLQRAKTLILALDYCLSCRGTCPTCVLSKDERLLAAPAMKVGTAIAAIETIAPMYPSIGHLALGVGRGNNLMLPKETIGDYLAIAAAAERTMTFDDGVMEISTSLVGKIAPQIERASQIIEAFKVTGRRMDPRFVVVANTALSSQQYWENLDLFLTSMEAARGGRRDGTGDIMQLNLATDSLPDVKAICEILSAYRFPVNLAWTPAFDAGSKSEEGLAAITGWIGEFHAQARRLGLDTNVVNRIDAVLSAGIGTIPEAVANVEGSAANTIYVAPDGQWHEGFASVLAEMDPIRYDPLSARGTGRAKVIGDMRTEVSRITRNGACMSCHHLPLCIATGAHKIGLIALRQHPHGTVNCPSGMRDAFESAAEGFAA
jgi:hypothetical protein